MTIAVHPSANAARNAGPGLAPYMDQGTGVARVRVYPAPRRALPTDAPGVAMIVEIPLLKPSASVDAAGVLTLLPGSPGLNVISGQGAWATIVNGNGDGVLDCDVSAVDGDGDIWLSAGGVSGLNLYAGGETSLTSGVLS